MRGFTWLAVASFVLAPAAWSADPPTKLKPVVVWTGLDSAQAKPWVARCITEEQWRETWKAHGTENGGRARAFPEVDFGAYMVLAVFQGQGSQNYGLFDFEITDESDCLRVRYVTGYYQIGGIPESNADERRLDTQSYAFLVLPKSNKAIVFEEAKDVRTRTGWKERGRIAAVAIK
jgi:hypothetical protein